MLGLELMKEFKGRRLKGTAIELTNNNNTGATQIPAAEFLKITYPTTDLLKTLEAAGPKHGRPVTLKGERGQGKSHLMAALYHALKDRTATVEWLNHWADLLCNEKIKNFRFRDGLHVISESLHRQHYKHLWDLLFDMHPHGEYCKGAWENLGDKKTDVPSDNILLDMFRHTPTALILDEFQTWFDGLPNTKQSPRQNWAFNFIQILSEIAKEHPDLLLLVVSVRNGNTDAFQQIQRVNPVIVDFKSKEAKHDRLHLLLHRLFENRIQISGDQIESSIEPHLSEFFRLKNTAPAEHYRYRNEFQEAWPFAPHLIQLLEDQVLMATNAQETRDLISTGLIPRRLRRVFLCLAIWKSRSYLGRTCFLAVNTPPLGAGDHLLNDHFKLECLSSTDLSTLTDSSHDLVITDPPFGGLLHYSELSDFFHVWLRLALKDRYPDYFSGEYTPKSLEAVANWAREPEDPDGFYQRLLTQCWREAHRILKSGGLLAFTFHHSEDEPWVAVLESLFDAGFYLEATYPIRGDETKGEGEFGSRKIEYDIIHVCRKRFEEPRPISWAKLRQQVLKDVRALQELLEHHQEEGLPEADLQVIRRGKALEYFSRHYGQVFKDPETPMSVQEALVGINQLLDEEAGGIKDPPPSNAEPFTRMMLRLFDGNDVLPRDQIQKFLRGTGSAPSDFLAREWVYEQKKFFYLTSPLDIAQGWVNRHRRKLTSDYEQAQVMIGACFESSGINAKDTLTNHNFDPHPALGALLTWHKTHGANSQIRNAAAIASSLYREWAAKNQPNVEQMSMFDELGGGVA